MAIDDIQVGPPRGSQVPAKATPNRIQSLEAAQQERLPRRNATRGGAGQLGCGAGRREDGSNGDR